MEKEKQLLLLSLNTIGAEGPRELCHALARELKQVGNRQSLRYFLSFPPHWLENRETCPALEELISGHSSGIILTGYSGAPHALLSEAELGQEIFPTERIKKKNLSALEAGLSGLSFFPYPDFSRPELAAKYCEKTPVLFPGAGPFREEALLLIQSGIYSIPFYQPRSPVRNRKGLYGARKKASASPGIIFFDLSLEETRKNLSVILESLARLKGASCPDSVEEWLKEAEKLVPITENGFSGSLFQRAGLLFNHSPEAREKIRGIRKTERGKAALIILGKPDFGSLPETEQQDTPAVPNRILLSDMPGDVFMEGTDLTVRFSKGSITGFYAGNSPITEQKPSRSYLTLFGHDFAFTGESPFALEGEGFRGLRNISVLKTPFTEKPAELTLEYIFADGHTHLGISGTLRHPVFREKTSIETSAPLEIPVFTLPGSEPVTITARDARGSSRGVTLSEETEILLIGNSFSLQKQNNRINLFFPHLSRKQNEEILPIRIRKTGTEKTLFIYPYGTIKPYFSAAGSETTERFLFFISNSDEPPPDAMQDLFFKPSLSVKT